MQPELFSYSIPHHTIRLASVMGGSRPLYIVADKQVPVEVAATEYLRSQGWWVINGGHASLFFSVLSANFRNSFFADVCQNYVGPDAKRLIQELTDVCEASLNAGKVSDAHLERAQNFLCHYYHKPSYHSLFKKLMEYCVTFPQTQKIGLVEMYRTLRYFTKGIPDLFAARPSEFNFIEVKSEGDSLSPEQYAFAEALFQHVGCSFLVLRILSLESDASVQLANPADTSADSQKATRPQNLPHPSRK